MKPIDRDTITRYLHRIRNHADWIPLNEVADSIGLDRATSRRYTNQVIEWELVERQQLENQPTMIRATKKLTLLQPGEVRHIVDAYSQQE